MTERLVFNASIEGMLRVLRSAPGDEVEPKVKALGFDRSNLLPAYPAAQYMQLVDLIGETVFPSLQGDARDRALGEAFIRGYDQTFLGRAALMLSRVVGPMRMSVRLPQTMRSVNNYTQGKVDVIDAKSVRITCGPVMRPHYYCGVFEEAGRLAGNPTYSVALESYAAETAVFVIRW